MRKYIHRHTYDYTDDELFDPNLTSPTDLGRQVRQCIEALRQELVCHVDQSLYLVWKDPTQLAGWNEDNSVRHKCRSYDRIKKWAELNRVHTLHDSKVYFPLIS